MFIHLMPVHVISPRKIMVKTPNRKVSGVSRKSTHLRISLDRDLGNGVNAVLVTSRTNCYTECQSLHLTQYVYLLPNCPAIEQVLCVMHHRIVVALNALTMKCRQQQAPVLLVQVTVNGQ